MRTLAFLLDIVLGQQLPAIGNRIVRDSAGAAAVVMALSLTAIAGLAALGTETANWYFTQRKMQGAVDAAAHSGAAALMNGATVSAAKTQAKSVAANYGFSSSSGATVTVNSPPSSGSHTGDSTAVEVAISQPQTLLISSLFLSNAPTLSSRAVALKPGQSNPPCLLTLDTNSETSLSTSGSASLSLNHCSIYVNSAGPAALSAGSTISAAAAYVVGSVTGSGLTTTQGTHTGVDPKTDPYRSVATPTLPSGITSATGSGCNQSSYKLTGNTSATINPNGGTYVFCKGLQVQGGSTLNLCPGTYFIDQGTLDIKGGGVLNAPPTASTTPAMSSAVCGSNTTGGVTIVLMNDVTGGNPADVSFGANSVITITAPTSGSLSGLALFQDRVTCSSCSMSLGGGSTQNIEGAIYVPNNPVTYNGGASSGGAACTQLIAYKLTLSGNSNLSSNCVSAGTATINVTSSQLVE